ncbi:hypothetical protein Scep_001095 [Stephania cephalantha]|uniref:Uncharacterized protein n=1 Tax=Stephania cephalantha TaxID=152367 RepID=A0AAP0LB40_9MAGN
MADALSVIPTAVLEESIGQVLYEKRKNAAQKSEDFESVHESDRGVSLCRLKKSSATRHGGDHDKITAMMNLLTNEFTSLPQSESSEGRIDWACSGSPLKLFPSPSDIRTLSYGGDMSSAKATLESETRKMWVTSVRGESLARESFRSDTSQWMYSTGRSQGEGGGGRRRPSKGHRACRSGSGRISAKLVPTMPVTPMTSPTLL